MKTSAFPRTFGGIALFIILVLLFFPLLLGQEFVFDDDEMVANNPELAQVKTLGDVFDFRLQPSKPITSFVMGFIHWIGGGSVLGHRAVSLALHLMVVGLVFATLSQIQSNLSKKSTIGTALAATVLFAIHPLHTETLGVSQFRGELLASCFSLIAIYGVLLQRRYGLVIAFVALGFAQLSKEVFAIILPILLVATYAFAVRNVNRRQCLRFAIGVLVAELIWGSLLYWLMSQDAAGNYNYQSTVGWRAVPPLKHLELAGRATVEGIAKFLSGSGLGTTPMVERGGLASGWGAAAYAAILFAFIISAATLFFGLKAKPVRLATVFFVVPLMAYLAVPNLYIGSEHYWYFPIIGGAWFLTLVTTELSNQTSHPRTLNVLIFFVALIVWISALESRALDYKNRRSFYDSELATHPEASANHVNLAVISMEQGAPDAEVEKFLRRAKELDPENVRLALTEYYYQSRRHNLAEMDKSITQLINKPIRKRLLSSVFLNYAEVSAAFGKCGPAKYSFEVAEKLDPQNRDVSTRKTDFLRGFEIGTQRCVDISSPNGLK